MPVNIIRLVALMIVIWAILLTKSLVGMVGVVLLPGVWFLTQKLQGRRLFGALVGLWMLSLIGQGVLILRTDPYVPDSRLRISRKLLMAWQQRPLTGWGVANVGYAFKAVEWPLDYQHDVYVDKAHGHLLEALVTTGVVGLILYLGMILGVGWVLIKSMKALRLPSASHSARHAQGDKVALESLATLSSEWEQILIVVWWMYLFHTQTNVVSIAEEAVWWMIVGIAMQTQRSKLIT